MSTLAARKIQIQTAVDASIANAKKLFNVDITTAVRFDLSGRVAGQAGRKNNACFLRFNTTMMMNEGWEHILNDTVPHEVAHLACYTDRTLGRNHDAGWKRVAIALGSTGKRCHDIPVEYKGGTYIYTTSTGATVNCSPALHTKIQNGRRYTARHKGQLNSACAWSLNGVVTPAQVSTAQPTVGVARTVGAVTTRTYTTTITKPVNKAVVVRAMIAAAKDMGYGQMHVIDRAYGELGMTRGLASTYVKNNWSKV